MIGENWIIKKHESILITGATGFIGSKVVENLLKRGFTKLRCFVRPSSDIEKLTKIAKSYSDSDIKLIYGNLLSSEDCIKATKGVFVIYHLAAGRGVKSFAGAYLNSVVATKNLLESTLKENRLRRFVNISSFSVYSNNNIPAGGLLDENCKLENIPEDRYEPYVYAKVRQDELVLEYNKKHNIPFVIVRPGVVFGPGNTKLTGRIGIDTFGFFLHLGGRNKIPFTYVDNCADAIVLAGLTQEVDGEVFNIVDDNLPTSRDFLKLYKKNVKKFRSFYMPYILFYYFCFFWEKYSKWSNGQLPPIFNKKRCSAYWKSNKYTNAKLKNRLHWKPTVPFSEATKRYFQACTITEDGID